MAKVYCSLLGEPLPRLYLGAYAFVTDSALSGEYSPGPTPPAILSMRFSPIVIFLVSSPNFLGDV